MPSSIAPFVAPQAPPPPSAPHAAPRAPAAHPFAEMLRQTRQSEPSSAPPELHESGAADASETPDAPRAPASAKAKTRTTSAPTPQRTSASQPTLKDSAEAATARPAEREPHAGATTNDAGLAQWIAELQWRAGSDAEAARADVDAAKGDTPQDIDAVGGGARRDPRNPADASRPGTDAKDAAVRDALDRAATLLPEKTAALDADSPRRLGDAPPAARAEPGAAPAPIGLASAPPAASAAPPIADVSVATPLHAPDFAQALGVQVSVLAKDGVQHAELHLNPAEMGPVSVQIVMDGTQARIEFGADLAQTRQALEAGIPELASALRDAGLTLSGGGVSEHARGGGDGARDNGDGRGRPAPDASASIEPLRGAGRRVALAGGVDVYA